MKCLGTGALLLFIVTASFGQAADPLINEFVANHIGADVNEFIEVFGDPTVDYSAFTVLEIEGDSGGSLGVVDGVFPVDTTNADGFWTTGFRSNDLENGTITLLLVENFSGRNGDDLDTDDDGVIDPAPPWARLVDDVAVHDGGNNDLTYSGVVLARGFDGNNTTPGGASRIPNGVDTDSLNDWLRNDPNGDGLPNFPDAPPAPSGVAVNTPGMINEPGFTPPPPPPPPGLIINEIDADTPGSDTREFIELYDSGVGHTPLDDLVVVLFNGSTDKSYRAFDLDGFGTDAAGFFVMGGSEVVPPPDLIIPNGSLQNGADAVALFAGDADDFPNGTPVTTDFLVDAVVYDSDDADDPGLLALLNPGQPQVNENALGDKTTMSIQRLPNGAGGARNTVTYTPFPSTPGAVNGGADLALQKTLTATTHDGATRTATFTLTLTNDGPADATGIEVTDRLPEGLPFARATASHGDYAPDSGLWTVGDLPRDAAATLHLTVTADPAGIFRNDAEVTAADQPDPDSIPGDGQGDDADTAFLGRPAYAIDRFQADLRLAMTVTPTTARVGDAVTFTLTVTDDGPSATAGVEVTDWLPDGLAYASDNGAGHYDPVSGVWRVGHLALGATKTLDITARVTGSGSITNVAEITHHHLPDPDSQLGNGDPDEDDQASATVEAQAAAAKATDTTRHTTALPTTFELRPNFPNPFHPETIIPFGLPEAAHVTITIYDVLGRAIATLTDGPRAAGWHAVRWDASPYPSGSYLILLQAKNKVFTRRLMLMN